jgi:hypothetical protein
MRILLSAIVLALLVSVGSAEVIRFPDDAGVVDVTKAPYNADNTGSDDATDAIQRAISDHVGSKHPRIIYLPAGTYRLSDTLFWRKFDDRRIPQAWGALLSMVGEDRERTILKLDDNLPDFNKPYTRAVLYTANVEGDSGNTAFYNHIRNLTIDVGNDNKNAIAIDWQSHNQGSLREVTLRAGRDSGAIGISLLRNAPGPHLIKNVAVDGFDWAIKTAPIPTYATWIEHLDLRNQRIGGIHIGDHSIAIRGLRSDLRVPVIASEPKSKSHLVLLDSTFTGGSAGVPAIDYHGSLLLRDVDASEASYGSLLRLGGQVQETGNRVEELAADAWKEGDPQTIYTLFNDSPASTLRLPVEETPGFIESDLSKWVNVADFGATPGRQDTSAAIQAAIDSTLPGAPNHGKTVLYLPPDPAGQNAYWVKDPIILRGSLKKIEGLSNRLQPMPGGAIERNREPLVRVEDVPSPFFIEDLEVNGTNFVTGFSIGKDAAGKQIIPVYTFTHAGKATLVLKRVTIAYRAEDGAGDVFVDDLVGGNHRFAPGQRAWLRHFNTEGYHDYKIRNDGATVWLFGHKTEWLAPDIHLDRGGKMEVLGGFYYPVKGTDPKHTAITVVDGDLAFSGKIYAWSSNATYSYLVRETQQGKTRMLPAAAFIGREAGWCVPLFRTGADTTTEGYEPPLDRSATGNLALGATVRASSAFHGPETAQYATDGDSVSDRSRWVSKNSSGTEWLEIDLNQPVTVARARLWFGTNGQAFRLLVPEGNGWKPLAEQSDKTSLESQVTFEPVTLSRLRVEFPDLSQTVRLFEVGLYAE